MLTNYDFINELSIKQQYNRFIKLYLNYINNYQYAINCTIISSYNKTILLIKLI